MSAHTDSRNSFTDVLIVGAGPSGLMAAQALARLGISVLIVDRRDPCTQYGNADGLQPRTLEIWQSYGMLESFSPKAATMHAIVTYTWDNQNNRFIRSSPSRNVVVDTRYPFEMTANIDIIEETLRQSMEEAGVRLKQPVSPSSLTFISKSADSVEVTHPVKVVLQHLRSDYYCPKCPKCPVSDLPCACCVVVPQAETVYAKYVIGADGAHSWVRHHLGISMEGDQTEYIWGVADVTVATDFPDCRFKCIIQSCKGAIIIIPREEEKIRIYVQLSPKDIVKTADGHLDKSAFSVEIVRTIILEHIRECLRPYTIDFTSVHWCAIFSVPQRVATQYSFRDRVFIVGDACHTHSPKAGQGANASMGDAHNLAWKLAYVLRGWANQSLLGTYEAERRKYAQDLISFDATISRLLNSASAAHYERMLHEQNMFTSGVGICYQSRLTNTENTCSICNLRAGERLPPSPLIRLGDWQPVELQDLSSSDGLFKLFVFGCDTLRSDQSIRISQFATGFEETVCLRRADRVSTYIILSDAKETVHWKDVPSIFQDWKRVFVSEEAKVSGAYSKFGIPSSGAAILVRPDGYISMCTELSDPAARRMDYFLQKL